MEIKKSDYFFEKIIRLYLRCNTFFCINYLVHTSSVFSNSLAGYAPAINTRSPVALFNNTLPGVPCILNNLAPSACCAAIFALSLLLSTHVANFASSRPTSLADALRTSVVGSPFANTADMKL